MGEDAKADSREKGKGFWQTLPGILTGLAALITAVTGLFLGILQTPLFNGPKNASDPGKNEARGRPIAAENHRSGAPEPHGSNATPAPSPTTIQQGEFTNLLASGNGGHLILATSEDFRRTIVGSEAYGVVGGHSPEEAVYGFRDGAAATFASFKMLVTQATPSNVKTFELLVSNDSPTRGFRSIGRFEVQNVIFADPYQEFRFPSVKARFLKIRLLSNQNGYKNPFEIREFQLLGDLD
jgi:hypothetical protein